MLAKLISSGMKNIETFVILRLSLFQKVTLKMNLQCNSTTVHFELSELLEFEYDFFFSSDEKFKGDLLIFRFIISFWVYML